MIKGQSIELADGQKWIVPPLSLGAVEVFQERLASYAGDLKSVSLVIDVLHASLKRNDPNITREAVAELVDLGNMNEVMFAVMNVSGLKRTDDSGEAVAGTATP